MGGGGNDTGELNQRGERMRKDGREEEYDKEGAREERRQQRKGLEERIKGHEGGVNEGRFVGGG